jgi:hypothetical protein
MPAPRPIHTGLSVTVNRTTPRLVPKIRPTPAGIGFRGLGSLSPDTNDPSPYAGGTTTGMVTLPFSSWPT